MFNQFQQQQPYGYGAPAMPYLPDFRPVQSAQEKTSNVSWIYVSGWDGARNQIVQPGQTGWMMDNNEPVIYVKAVDTMGTATLKGFRMTEISPQDASVQPRDDMSAYVKKDELDAISGRLKAIEDLIGGVNA